MKRMISFLMMMIICFLIIFVPVKGDNEVYIVGKVYECDKKSDYEYTASMILQNDACGLLSISKNVVADGLKDGFSSYKANANELSLTYTFSKRFPVANNASWNLAEDKSKTVANVKLKENIGNGALIVQTSTDGRQWVDDITISNAFAETRTLNFYTTNSVQITNGCYYRIIAAYKIGRKIGQKQVLKFIKQDQFEYKKFVEIYEFYLHGENDGDISESNQSRFLGELTKASVNKGYSGNNKIGINDPHYGWEIGKFFVSGYTRAMEDQSGNAVFLKNVGDQITLWFQLEQNINALNGEKVLSVANDDDGYDQYFQTDKMNMKRGTLIIRYTDEKNVKHKPEIYSNYLAANASTNADTVVKLFEEGDYEVALDYKIKKTPRKVLGIEVLPEYSDYRIFFRFSVRNGNCMIYPFDLTTGAELSDQSVTPNGFRLDMARSRYLNIDVKRSVLIKGENGYAEDVRFNRPATDGDQYKDEGIYTFSVKNLYTGENTVKTIYVGTSKILKTLAENGGNVEKLNEQATRRNANIIIPATR